MRRSGSVELKRRMVLLPFAGGVLFPGNTIVLPDVDALSEADWAKAREGRLVIAVVPVHPSAGSSDEPATWSEVATEARVIQLNRLPDGRVTATVKGLRRLALRERPKARGGRVTAQLAALTDKAYKRTARFEAALRQLKGAALKVAAASPMASDDLKASLAHAYDAASLGNLIVPQLLLGFDERLKIFAETDVPRRVSAVLAALAREHEYLLLSEQIRKKVQGDVHANERRAYLQEQVRLLQQELGETDDLSDELDELERELEALDLPEGVREVVDRELDRMDLMAPGSSEYMVSYSYICWIKDLPWGTADIKPPPPLSQARRVLNRQHFGLGPVKEKILEHLAVMRHKGETRGQILLLSGPPGVGKTSLARSVAEALGRPFVRIALGGVKDEAEIRGHRRTYIGSMPGKLIHALKQAKSTAPVILLDEIEKVGLDQGRGALSSALLEVLDYEQNKNFIDHYLGVPYDLSQVVFIATANSVDPIPEPLLDRMELVELTSYTEQEKLEIARRHLLPELCKELGLTKTQMTMAEKTLQTIVREYTREAGVRQFKRELATIGRKVVKAVVDGKRAPKVTVDSLSKFLGQPRHFEEPREVELPAGVAIGLAYTSVGGDILYIETSRTMQPGAKGGGRLSLTGSLGKVMRESAQTAVSYLSALAQMQPGLLAMDATELLESHIHLHFPDGATPKDGPSAGVAIMCAIASIFTRQPLPAKLAMTGEVTLRGQVLPVGGIKEKLLAAHRYGKTRVIMPAANQRDLEQVPKEILKDLDVVLVRTMEDVLYHAGLEAASADMQPVSKRDRSRLVVPRRTPRPIPELH